MITPFPAAPRRCSECGRPAGAYTHPFTGDPLCVLCEGAPPPDGPPIIAMIGRCDACERLAALYSAGDALAGLYFCGVCLKWEVLS